MPNDPPLDLDSFFSAAGQEQNPKAGAAKERAVKEFVAKTYAAKRPLATSWQLKTKQLDLTTGPTWMGVINVTPDSFSEGGCFTQSTAGESYTDVEAAVKYGLRLVQEGAGILDVGGESTRPDAEPVCLEEELRRVTGVVRGLARQTTVPISIDTSKAAVARAAVEAGAEIINDVTGLTGDAEMLSTVVETGAGVCCMHMQGTPQTMQDDPTYKNVVKEIYQYLKVQRDRMIEAGVRQEKICLDPGIGFGKTVAHNLELMQQSELFHTLGCPLLVGHSRKGFLRKLLVEECENRDLTTASTTISLALQRVQIIRVHNVKLVRQAYETFAACSSFCW